MIKADAFKNLTADEIFEKFHYKKISDDDDLVGYVDDRMWDGEHKILKKCIAISVMFPEDSSDMIMIESFGLSGETETMQSLPLPVILMEACLKKIEEKGWSMK